MVTVAFVEINIVCVPLCVLFLLMTLPIPLVGFYAAQLVYFVERNRIYLLRPLILTGIVFTVAFFIEMKHWQAKYSSHVQFNEVGLALQQETKRLRMERNMYIHALAAILCLAVSRIARLMVGDRAKRSMGAGAAQAPPRQPTNPVSVGAYQAKAKQV